MSVVASDVAIGVANGVAIDVANGVAIGVANDVTSIGGIARDVASF